MHGSRNVLDTEELTMLTDAIEQDKRIQESNFVREDGEGLKAKTVLWNKASDDITGAITRSEKIAGTVEQVRTV